MSYLWILLLTTVIIIIILTTAWVGRSFKTIQVPRIVGHLQLEIPSQPHQLLMLLDSGLQFKERRVSDQNKKREFAKREKTKERKNLLLDC